MQFPWWWSAFATLAAYIGGIITKPVTDWIVRVQDRRRLQKAVESEFWSNYEGIQRYQMARYSYEQGLMNGRSEVIKPSFGDFQRRDVWDYALKNPILFRELKGTELFSDFYRYLDFIKEKPIEEHRAANNRFMLSVAHAARRGQLSGRRFRKHRRYWRLDRLQRAEIAVRSQSRWTPVLKLYLRLVRRNVPSLPEGAVQFMFDPEFGFVRSLWKGLPGEPVGLNTKLERLDYLNL